MKASLSEVRELLGTRMTDEESNRWFLRPNPLLGNDLPINYVRARELPSVLQAAHAAVSA
jgi:hypothetical protein